MLRSEVSGDGVVHPERVDCLDNLLEDAHGFFLGDLLAFDVLFESALIGLGDDGCDYFRSDFFFHFQEMFWEDHLIGFPHYITIEF